MVNYSNGKIYKIEPINGDDMIYIGSTTKEYLSQRMDVHRSKYKRWKNGIKDYCMSFDVFEKHGIENCQIILLENYSCETKDQLTAREAYFQRTMKCTNKRIEGRTKKEWRETNNEKLKIYWKQHRKENKEHLQQVKKNYRENNKEVIKEHCKIIYECSCGSLIRHVEKARHERSKKHLKYLESTTIET